MITVLLGLWGLWRMKAGVARIVRGKPKPEEKVRYMKKYPYRRLPNRKRKRDDDLVIGAHHFLDL